MAGGDVKRRVAILVSCVDIDQPGAVGEDILNHRELGALDGKVEDCGIEESIAA